MNGLQQQQQQQQQQQALMSGLQLLLVSAALTAQALLAEVGRLPWVWGDRATNPLHTMQNSLELRDHRLLESARGPEALSDLTYPSKPASGEGKADRDVAGFEQP